MVFTAENVCMCVRFMWNDIAPLTEFFSLFRPAFLRSRYDVICPLARGPGNAALHRRTLYTYTCTYIIRTISPSCGVIWFCFSPRFRLPSTPVAGEVRERWGSVVFQKHVLNINLRFSFPQNHPSSVCSIKFFLQLSPSPDTRAYYNGINSSKKFNGRVCLLAHICRGTRCVLCISYENYFYVRASNVFFFDEFVNILFFSFTNTILSLYNTWFSIYLFCPTVSKPLFHRHTRVPANVVYRIKCKAYVSGWF